MSATGFGRAAGCGWEDGPGAAGAAVVLAAAFRAIEGEDGWAFSLSVPWDDGASVGSGASNGSEEGSGARKGGEGGRAGWGGGGMAGMGNSVCAIWIVQLNQ